MLNSDEAEIQSSYQADIKTYVEEMVLKFIMGQESLDNFGEYQETLKSLHIEDMIAIKQAAMDRFEAR
jgi:putative aldouronate transport system substrate-binding protein